MSFSPEFSYRNCPWCGTQDVALIVQHRELNVRVARGGPREWSWLSCPRCGGVVSIETHTNAQQILRVVPGDNETAIKIDHLPADVSEYFNNAQKVLNAGVPSAAAVELRRTLEAAAAHQGVRVGTLVKAIEDLAAKGLITANFVAVMGHIRKVGNVGAHASDQVLTPDEVTKAMAFTVQVLRNLFEIPKELELLGTPGEATAEPNEMSDEERQTLLETNDPPEA